MYINHWDYEHQSYEPCSIANPLEDISAIIHESNANETYMNFQAQQHHEFDIPIWSNEFSMPTTTDSPFLYCQGCKDNYSENITKQDQPTTCFKLGSESLMSSSEDSISSCEKCSEFPSCSDKRVLESDFSPDHKSHEISFQKTQWESCTKQDKQSSPCGFDFATSTNSDFKITAKGKRRLRWTKELNESFIMIVNQLGGPEKAKPKAILKMMGVDVLTISHVKSHLQKYRSTLHTHKCLKGISEEVQITDGINELQVKIQMQIEESRQLQLEVERSNQRQFEIQRNLQLVIEQQKKQLKLMLDQQKKITKQEKMIDLKRK
ncbi:putative transcription factor MYB-HB-like family [Medicago truncatula]|uniref:Myb-like DNA-binding domain, shaqkyf class protein n=1 Tax=Medicago truncatula TaxID=3880 RepID=A0A072VJ98_MEDTR|nr:myb family transcription factor PHL5 [Medicago truncatula]KEH41691.1 myb-like DNA-binding domain, shaqkyf class protein [Medicago truncatula]RHN79241.1 putative transcription factor MYB-HB-like family [Medicago truncatula]